ncbi:large subunit GTPase 1 homolog [Frankliniella occidentalis]|uniref:Large subunit GTPase 1 homolog n=1 Tax=Frankliniella occidentalis TaxID=133901 RepID=A0A6J1SBS5_FRAOC|nr:large subunit GTPase 1 homolog [Frankliniella occidentalis]
MSRKNKPSTSLGRALIKDRFGAQKGRRGGDVSMLHTSEIDDGYDWGRLNLQSVTEESSFQEFLSTAELANSEFQAEKLNIKFVNPLANIGLLSKEEREAIEKSHKEHQGDLQIPRRPHWTEETTAAELEALEKQTFLEWRRRLALLQESEGLLLTPYEKNLEFWRQLWRVVERSDVIVQIVDARNPLLFRCADLEAYAKEVSPNKLNLILINKADFLTEKQREAWAEYFTSISVGVAFFSATLAADEDEDENNTDKDSKGPKTSTNSKVVDGPNSEDESEEEDEAKGSEEIKQTDEESTEEANVVNPTQFSKSSELDGSIKPETSNSNSAHFSNTDSVSHSTSIANLSHQNSSQLLSRKELIEFLKTVHKGPKLTNGVTTVGLVGYPNVGKSSTINSLMAEKKVSVSATPGKTKHFQTLFLDSDLMLCDCPGLVMPSFVSTRADMVLNGILPIDQLRDHVQPINMLSSLIPRHVLEDTYGIMLPKPLEGEDPLRHPSSQELLNAYGYNRGFMTHKGIPDNPRAARIILKDFVTGKLLYCCAPPGVIQDDFHTFPPRCRQTKHAGSVVTPQGEKIMRPNKMTSADLDKVFFEKANIKAHHKGRQLIKTGNQPSDEQSVESKPWKKHNNRNKKEKLRRLYGHLDA